MRDQPIHPQSGVPWFPPGGRLAYVLLLLLALAGPGRGAGLPPVEQLRPSRQGFSDFCLSTCWGSQGNLYVGHEEGVLEYDGQNWRRLRTPGRTQVRSVLALPDGRLIYGGTNEFGWFAADSAGNWRARQLSDSLRGRAPHFREVRSVLQLSHGLYFQSKELLARWQGGQLQSYVPSGEVGAALALGDTLFVQLSDRGLCRLRPELIPRTSEVIPDGALEPLLGPELFALGNRLICLLPLEKGRLLLGTRFKGLFLWEQGRLSPLPELSERIRGLDLFHGIKLRDGRLALATLQGGVFLLDPKLRDVEVLDAQAGLPGPMAVHVSQDSHGNLWLANTDGVCQVGLELPYRQYGEAGGLAGQPTCLETHEGALLVGTTQGAFRRRVDGAGGDSRFERIPDLGGICWQLLSTRHGLLAIQGGHLIVAGQDQGRPLMSGQPTLLFQDQHLSERVWVGVAGRLRTLLWRQGKWTGGEEIPLVSGEITSMAQRSPGEFWLGTSDTGLWRVRSRPGGWDVLNLGKAQGLEPGAATVRSLGARLLVLTGERALELDAQGVLRQAGDFVPPPGWTLSPALRLTVGPDGTCWGSFLEGLAAWKPGAGSPRWDVTSFASAGPRPGSVLQTSEGLWVLTPHQLLHFQARKGKEPHSILPPVQLRSLLLGGRQWVGTAGVLQAARPRGGAPLEVAVACANLSQDGPVQYSFFLEGLDEHWTAWSPSGLRRLDFLPPGEYSLRVRVRMGGHAEHEVRMVSFRVPAPWYRWTWLQILAVAALIGLILSLTRRRARRLGSMNAALQAEIQVRRRAEAALRGSETRYRSLFENTLDAIFLLDETGILEGNPAAARLFGLSPDELNGRGFADLSPARQPDGRSSLVAAEGFLERARAGEQLSYEWLHQRADERPLLVEVSLSPLELDGRRLLLAILRDVSDRRQLETQLRQSQKMEAVGRLAGGVAHDFNNILVVILGQCDLLLMSLDSHDPVRDEVQQVRDAAQRAAQLTRQLLVFSRRSTLHPQRVSLNSVLGDLEKMLRRVIGEDVRIRLDLAPDLLRVNVDTGQMDQVILNLVVNARDAMPGGGELTIRTRNVTPGSLLAKETGLPEGQPQVQLSISDTGHGMPPEVMAHIFEPFFTTKEAGQGTGLGLATVYGIVTQSEGRVRVQSEVGQGTTFHIYLPAVPGETLMGRDGVVRELAGPGGSERVLLVEDETAVREVLLRTLQNNGYQVSTAAHGQEALDLIGQGLVPQLILSDVVMPELGGFELVRQLREQGLRQPIILMTGYTDRDLNPELLDGLEVSLLTKPFGPGVLLREVRGRLDAAAQDSAD